MNLMIELRNTSGMKQEEATSLKDALYAVYNYKDLYPFTQLYNNDTGQILVRTEFSEVDFVDSFVEEFVSEAFTTVSSARGFYLN